MKILVTGAGGFVGRTLVEELSKQSGLTVYSLINKRANLAGKTDFGNSTDKISPRVFAGDIRAIKCLNELPLPPDLDAIIHAAGLAHQFGQRDDRDFWEVNVLGTENVARSGGGAFGQTFYSDQFGRCLWQTAKFR